MSNIITINQHSGEIMIPSDPSIFSSFVLKIDEDSLYRVTEAISSIGSKTIRESSKLSQKTLNTTMTNQRSVVIAPKLDELNETMISYSKQLNGQNSFWYKLKIFGKKEVSESVVNELYYTLDEQRDNLIRDNISIDRKIAKFKVFFDQIEEDLKLINEYVSSIQDIKTDSPLIMQIKEKLLSRQQSIYEHKLVLRQAILSLTLIHSTNNKLMEAIASVGNTTMAALKIGAKIKQTLNNQNQSLSDLSKIKTDSEALLQQNNTELAGTIKQLNNKSLDGMLPSELVEKSLEQIAEAIKILKESQVNIQPLLEKGIENLESEIPNIPESIPQNQESVGFTRKPK